MERKTIPSIIQEKIQSELKKRNVKDICPMCGERLELADAFIVPSIYARIDQKSSANWTIPCVMLLCANCGYMSQHALGALGLMQEVKDVEKNET